MCVRRLIWGDAEAAAYINLSYLRSSSLSTIQKCLLPLSLSLCVVPVGFKVSKPSLQVIEKIHFLAALRTVDVEQLTVI